MTLKRYLLSVLAGLLALPAAHALADIPIAVVGPMTGDNATFGAQMKAGAEMAVADVNAAGGVLGQKIELVVGDDACDPRQARDVANQVVSRGVRLVVGHYCSGSSIPASEVYNEASVIQISPASTNPQLTEMGRTTVFRVCGRDDNQGVVAANFIIEHFPGKKIAIVHDKQTYSKGLADATKKQLNARGVEEVLYETVTRGEKDYSALISKLKQAEVDVLYYGGYHTEAGLITRQMREQGLKTQLISGDALVTSEYWSITGPLGEGTMMTFGLDPTKDPANAAIVQRFTDKNLRPEGYTLYTYAAVQVWVDAVKKAGTLDPTKVVEAMRNNTFPTVLGPISFDDKGDVKQPTYVMYQWKDGKYDYYTK
ncbi:MAG: branched-chain amino acid ABC transporter substrate-binding protein [Rhodospirillales bacterium]